MTDRSSVSYGQSKITDQPNTDTEREPCTAVCLTPAEARVLSLLPTYRTLAAIGSQLGIGRPTVKTHVENIYKKLGATNRAEAVNLAETAGLLPVGDGARQQERVGRPSVRNARLTQPRRHMS
jgi:DNA-binding CsgD family transcriptional regulator